MSNCGHPPAIPELKTSHTHLRVCADAVHVPSLLVENTFFSPCDCRDGTEHRGNPNCARADDLTRNSHGSGSGKNPHLIRKSRPVEKSFM